MLYVPGYDLIVRWVGFGFPGVVYFRSLPCNRTYRPCTTIRSGPALICLPTRWLSWRRTSSGTLAPVGGCKSIWYPVLPLHHRRRRRRRHHHHHHHAKRAVGLAAAVGVYSHGCALPAPSPMSQTEWHTTGAMDTFRNLCRNPKYFKVKQRRGAVRSAVGLLLFSAWQLSFLLLLTYLFTCLCRPFSSSTRSHPALRTCACSTACARL